MPFFFLLTFLARYRKKAEEWSELTRKVTGLKLKDPNWVDPKLSTELHFLTKYVDEEEKFISKEYDEVTSRGNYWTNRFKPCTIPSN